jgi:hypothetical protein
MMMAHVWCVCVNIGFYDYLHDADKQSVFRDLTGSVSGRPPTAAGLITTVTNRNPFLKTPACVWLGNVNMACPNHFATLSINNDAGGSTTFFNDVQYQVAVYRDDLDLPSTLCGGGYDCPAKNGERPTGFEATIMLQRKYFVDFQHSPPADLSLYLFHADKYQTAADKTAARLNFIRASTCVGVGTTVSTVSYGWKTTTVPAANLAALDAAVYTDNYATKGNGLWFMDSATGFFHVKIYPIEERTTINQYDAWPAGPVSVSFNLASATTKAVCTRPALVASPADTWALPPIATVAAPPSFRAQGTAVARDDVAPTCGSTQTGTWVSSMWSICSTSCGNTGYQTRVVQCQSSTGTVLANSACTGTAPFSQQTCSGQSACPEAVTWYQGAWGACSLQCGSGSQSRVVECRGVTSGTTVADSSCITSVGTKPGTTTTCNPSACEWVLTVDWGSCTLACGGGSQTRSYVCRSPDTSVVVTDGQCLSTKPATTRDCNLQACTTYAWSTGAYGTCSLPCNSGTQTRAITCINSATTTVVADTNCDTPSKPAAARSCNTASCTWLAGAFSTCSQACTPTGGAAGSQTRTVTCQDATGVSVAVTNCPSATKPATTQVCGQSACPTYSWEVGTWSACPVTCGGGTMTRTVQCVANNGLIVADSQCNGAAQPTKPATAQACGDSVTCDVLHWYTSAWGPICSARCGTGGSWTRTVQVGFSVPPPPSSFLFNPNSFVHMHSAVIKTIMCWQIQHVPQHYQSPSQQMHALWEHVLIV